MNKNNGDDLDRRMKCHLCHLAPSEPLTVSRCEVGPTPSTQSNSMLVKLNEALTTNTNLRLLSKLIPGTYVGYHKYHGITTSQVWNSVQVSISDTAICCRGNAPALTLKPENARIYPCIDNVINSKFIFPHDDFTKGPHPHPSTWFTPVEPIPSQRLSGA